jgi:hypothetical protein
MPSIVRPLDDLSARPTRQLLALRDRLLRCEASLAASDVRPADAAREIDPDTIRFKDDPRWTAMYEAVKAELATREHVARPAERRARTSTRRGRSPRPRAARR